MGGGHGSAPAAARPAAAWTVRERARRPGSGPAAEATGDAPARMSAPEVATPEERAEADALDELGDEIARLAGHEHAFKYHMLTLIAEFDRRKGWEPGGHRSCTEWLAWRTGYHRVTAREHVRVARALESLPHTSQAMAEGRLSFSQVRALTRVATPEHEEELVALAEGTTVARLERMVRGWKKGTRQDERARERERHRSRRLAVFPDEEGMVVVRGRLMPEAGELLMRALEAAEDALFREEDREEERPATERARRRAARRRRADAAGLVAERALAAGFGGEDAPVSGTRAERYQALLHVDGDTLREESDEPGRSELGGSGTRVSAESSRRLTCDAAVVEMLRGPEGEVLDVGRKRRTVSPAIRRALEVRDRGCRFPGCGLRFTDAHHVKHWADGGATSLDNCVLLCAFHHRLVHEGGWRVEWWGRGYAVFLDPRGGVHTAEPPERPPLPGADRASAEGGEGPAAAVVRENRRRGVRPGPMTAGARWMREGDIPRALYYAALEAGIASVDGGVEGGGDATRAPP